MPAGRTYSDFNLDFSRHPGTGDISKLYDDNDIQQAIRNLVFTKNYERPFHSEIGSQLHKLLFSNETPTTVARIKKTIENVVNNFEPRVNLIGVVVIDQSVNNAYVVTIYYNIRNTSEERQVELTLERSR